MKISLLVIFDIFGLLVKTLIADDKYSLLHSDNLTEPIQMQLSKNYKNCAQFFAVFLKYRSNFEHFQKKDDAHSL